MWNCPDKFKIVNWNSFDVTCKNENCAIFTHSINFPGPSNQIDYVDWTHMIFEIQGVSEKTSAENLFTIQMPTCNLLRSYILHLYCQLG